MRWLVFFFVFFCLFGVAQAGVLGEGVRLSCGSVNDYVFGVDILFSDFTRCNSGFLEVDGRGFYGVSNDSFILLNITRYEVVNVSLVVDPVDPSFLIFNFSGYPASTTVDVYVNYVLFDRNHTDSGGSFGWVNESLVFNTSHMFSFVYATTSTTTTTSSTTTTSTTLASPGGGGGAPTPTTVSTTSTTVVDVPIVVDPDVSVFDSVFAFLTTPFYTTPVVYPTQTRIIFTNWMIILILVAVGAAVVSLNEHRLNKVVDEYTLLVRGRKNEGD